MVVSGIENSVTRVTVRHHGTCQVMPSSYPAWQNFQSAPHDHYRFFFLHSLPLIILYKLEYALFYEFYANISQLAVKKCSFPLPSMMLMLKCLAENDIKKWCQIVRKIPWCHVVVVLAFYGPLTPYKVILGYPNHTVPAANLLGSLPVLSAHSFASNWQLPFLNQRERMAIDIISWLISMKECCMTWRSNP